MYSSTALRSLAVPPGHIAYPPQGPSQWGWDEGQHGARHTAGACLSWGDVITPHPLSIPAPCLHPFPNPSSLDHQALHCPKSSRSVRTSSSSLLQERVGERKILVVSQSVVVTEGLGWKPGWPSGWNLEKSRWLFKGSGGVPRPQPATARRWQPGAVEQAGHTPRGEGSQQVGLVCSERPLAVPWPPATFPSDPLWTDGSLCAVSQSAGWSWGWGAGPTRSGAWK